MSAIETTPPAASAREAAPPRPLWQVILIRPETMTLVLLILGVFVASLLSPFFLDVSYILRQLHALGRIRHRRAGADAW